MNQHSDACFENLLERVSKTEEQIAWLQSVVERLIFSMLGEPKP